MSESVSPTRLPHVPRTPTVPLSPRWLRYRTVPEHYPLSSATVERWVRAKKLVTHRIGGVTLLNANDLDELILRHDADGNEVSDA